MKDFDVENDLSINRFRLDEECVSHAGIYYRYADACADAKNEMNLMKDNLDVVRAERLLEIKEECANNGKKVTVDVLNAMVESDHEVKNARDKLREVEGIYAKLNVAVQALDARRSELDNLVKLSVSNYYASSDNKTSTNSDNMVQREIRKSMNKDKE